MITLRRSRWLVSVAIVGGVALAAALPALLPASADPVPVLPPLTPAQLLDKVSAVKVMAFSGDMKTSVRLGLPSLGSLGVNVPRSLLDLLGGTNTEHVWVDGPDHQRLAIDGTQSETDWVHNGADFWSWDSTTQQVKHATLSADKADTGFDPKAEMPTTTPDKAAADLLANIDPSTEVSVRTPGYVAGRPVYELVVSPKSADSTISAGVIAVDAATGLALEVRIEAKGDPTPVVKIGFTSISFDTPGATTFAFTPPTGSTVTEVTNPADLFPISGYGEHGHRGSSGDGGRRQKGDRSASAASDPTTAAPTSQAKSPTVMVGKDWTTVAVMRGPTLGGQLGGLLSGAPVVATPGGNGHLLKTALVNLIMLDDGRIAIGAVNPTALAAAIPVA